MTPLILGEPEEARGAFDPASDRDKPHPEFSIASLEVADRPYFDASAHFADRTHWQAAMILTPMRLPRDSPIAPPDSPATRRDRSRAAIDQSVTDLAGQTSVSQTEMNRACARMSVGNAEQQNKTGFEPLKHRSTETIGIAVIIL